MRFSAEEAYHDGAAWAAGPQAVYDRLATHTLDVIAVDLAGAQCLDAGAGTGAVTLQLLSRGAEVVATDLSRSMLAEIDRQSSGRVRTCVADIRTLPAPDRAFDFAFAGFVLNHLRDPAVGLAELGRVTRTGGSVVATSFGTDQHPVKAAIEAVLRAHGWEPPEWYDEIKATVMPLTATVEAFTGVGRRAGFPDGMTHAIDVDLGDLPVEVVAAYRLGMAHTVPFLAGLNGAARARLTRDAERAVTGMPPLRLPLLVFHAVKR